MNVNRSFNMGGILGGEDQFHLTEKDLSVHSCVLGQSGSGKSKFLEQLMRYLLAADRGFCLIDPHGDLSEDLLAYALQRKFTKGHSGFERIHYLEPSFEQVFCYDPFRFRPIEGASDDTQRLAYRQFIHTKVLAVGEVLQRKQNQAGFDGMPRLERVLTDVLTAIATAVGTSVWKKGVNRGKHLPLSESLVMLDVFHPRHMEIYECVAPNLDESIQSDFDRWHSLMKRNPDAILRETESTLNRLRSFLSPVVKAIFSDHVDSIDFFDIMQKGEILLVNLRQTNYFSADQANAIGGLFIHEILSTAQNTPRELRKKFYLLVDEAGEFIGADIQEALGTMRKFELPICLAAQDLSSFVKGDLDLRPKVLSQCGTIVSFRQTWPDDLDILVRVMGTGNLDFKKHYQIVDRPDGYDFIPMQEYSRNFTFGTNWTNGFSVSESHSHSDSETEGWQKSRSKTLTLQNSTTHGTQRGGGGSDNSSMSESTTKGSVAGQSPVVVDKRLHSMIPTQSEQKSSASSSQRTHSSTWSSSQSRADTHGRSIADSAGGGTSGSEGHTVTEGTAISANAGIGGTEGRGLSISDKTIPLGRTREERHVTSQLEDLLTDQLEKMKQQMHSLGVAEAIAKKREEKRAVAFKTHMVKEVWLPEDKFFAIEKAKKKAAALRTYFVTPEAPKPEPVRERPKAGGSENSDFGM